MKRDFINALWQFFLTINSEPLRFHFPPCTLHGRASHTDTTTLYTPPLVCHPNMPPTAPDEPYNSTQQQEKTLDHDENLVVGVNKANNVLLSLTAHQRPQTGDCVVRCQLQSALTRLTRPIRGLGNTLVVTRRNILLARHSCAVVARNNSHGIVDKNGTWFTPRLWQRWKLWWHRRYT